MNVLYNFFLLLGFLVFFISAISHSESSLISFSIGAGFNNTMTLEDQNSSANTPPAIFGEGHHSKGENNDLLNISLGFSYQVKPWFDLEVKYDYQGMTFNGNANFTHAGSYQPTTADIRSDGLFLGGRFNFHSLLNDSHSNINPYFSLGIGITKITSDKVHFSFPALKEKNNVISALTTSAGGTNTNGAFRIGAGFDWPFTAKWGTSVSYHFYHLGDMKTDEGTAYIYGHGIAKDTETNKYGKLLYVDGLKSKIQTNILSIDLWRRF